MGCIFQRHISNKSIAFIAHTVPTYCQHANIHPQHANVYTQQANVHTQHANVYTQHANMHTQHANMYTQHANMVSGIMSAWSACPIPACTCSMPSCMHNISSCQAHENVYLQYANMQYNIANVLYACATSTMCSWKVKVHTLGTSVHHVHIIDWLKGSVTMTWCHFLSEVLICNTTLWGWVHIMVSIKCHSTMNYCVSRRELHCMIFWHVLP